MRAAVPWCRRPPNANMAGPIRRAATAVGRLRQLPRRGSTGLTDSVIDAVPVRHDSLGGTRFETR